MGLTCHKWKADTTKAVGMHKIDDSNVTLTWPPRMCIKGNILRPTLNVRLLQGKESTKYTYEDSYKEKTSNPRKRCQHFTTTIDKYKTSSVMADDPVLS